MFSRKHWRLVAGVGLIVALLCLIRLFVPDFNREVAIGWGESLSGPGFIVAFLILPLLGFPLTIFLVIAGMKFGIGWGMLVATIAIGLHNLAAYSGTNFWAKKWVERLLEGMGYEIPKIPHRHHAWFTAAFTFVPGLPYAIKLYGLALTNISFDHYFLIGWPIYSLSCLVYVGLGGAVTSLSLGWIVGIALGGSFMMYLMKHWIQRLDKGERRPTTDDTTASSVPS